MMEMIHLMANALADTIKACMERVEMNQNTLQELEPTFEWCLHEMEQIIIEHVEPK